MARLADITEKWVVVAASTMYRQLFIWQVATVDLLENKTNLIKTEERGDKKLTHN